MKEKETESFYPANAEEWRAWLQEHHHKKASVWLICYKKKSGTPTVSWSEAVDEALCFGWIDGKRKTMDAEKFIQFFSRRKAKSTWSKVNKDKIRQLTDKGLMTQSGLAAVEIAKQNGSWTVLDPVEALEIPEDLYEGFKIYPGSLLFFEGLSKSLKKQILHWIVFAKRSETRQKRILQIAELAAAGKKPF
jgi:uncharacterized protein YdeI (YjbR/CyaY-like superfamily)